jgi:hypothetical protein
VFRHLESCMVTFREDMVTPEAFHTIMHVMNEPSSYRAVNTCLRQDTQCASNVTMRRVRVTIAAVQKQ